MPHTQVVPHQAWLNRCLRLSHSIHRNSYTPTALSLVVLVIIYRTRDRYRKFDRRCEADQGAWCHKSSNVYSVDQHTHFLSTTTAIACWCCVIPMWSFIIAKRWRARKMERSMSSDYRHGNVPRYYVHLPRVADDACGATSVRILVLNLISTRATEQYIARSASPTGRIGMSEASGLHVITHPHIVYSIYGAFHTKSTRLKSSLFFFFFFFF